MPLPLIIVLATFASAFNVDKAVEHFTAGKTGWAAVYLVTGIIEAAIVWKVAQRIQ